MVTQFFPTPESWRGAFCYDFAQAVVRTGKYDVRVVVVSHMPGPDYDYNGIHVLRCRDYVWKLNFGRILLNPLNRKVFEAKIHHAGIEENNIAVVHCHDIGYVGLLSGMKRRNPKIKVMLHFHNGGHPFTVATPRLGVVPLYSTLLYLFARWSFRLVDIPIFVSERQRRMFGRWYPHGPLGEAADVLDSVVFGRFVKPIELPKSYVLYNGIDYSVFNSTGRLVKDGFTIGCVANVDQWKDQMTLLRAVRRLAGRISGLHVVIIGSGPMLQTCKDYVQAQSMSDMVSFMHEVDHMELPDIYRSFDLLVIPSFLEGFCCSYMESWGCGTPVMGCRNVCLDEAIVQGNQDHWLINPGDDKTLSELIYAYWQKPIPQQMICDFDINKLVSGFICEVLA